jgi:dipeptidyl aminopeptidase/acylaminoacyl peptidase
VRLFFLILGITLCLNGAFLVILRREAPSSGWYLYESNAMGNRDIYRSRLDATEGFRLTSDPHFDVTPTWSPDGGTIAYVSNRAGNWDIYQMSSYGHAQIRLTDHDADDYQPTWSPDGEWIVFVSTRDGNANIYRMRADGSTPHRLTHTESDDDAPRWSDDGEWISYVSFFEGNRSFRRIRPDGSQAQDYLQSNQEFYFYAPTADADPISPLVDLKWRPWLVFLLGGLGIICGMVRPQLESE